MADGRKHFDFFELFRQDKGRFITLTDHIDEFTTIRGLAARGTLETDASWLLERTIVENGVVVEVEYADDAQFTQTWTGRLGSFGPPAAGTGAAAGDTNFFMPAVRIFTSAGTVYSPTGGGVTGLHTLVGIDNVSWTALPAVPRNDRVSLNIMNDTGQDVKVNFATPAGYEGMVIRDQQERIYTLFPLTTALATHIVYAKSAIGAVTLDIEEISQ